MSFSRLRISEIHLTDVFTDGFYDPLAICSSTIGIVIIINFVVENFAWVVFCGAIFECQIAPTHDLFFLGIQILLSIILVARS
jgi:hypothetical protein